MKELNNIKKVPEILRFLVLAITKFGKIQGMGFLQM